MNTKQFVHFVFTAIAAAFVVTCVPAIAHAHTGVDPVHDLLHGLEHPLSGFDHLCAMLAVGIWATQLGGRSIGVMPAAFIVALAIGVALGMDGVSLPYVEPGIALSVVILGVLVATAAWLPLGVSVAIVSLFALVHGYAHGAETPATASGVFHATGFLVATVCLLAVGVGFGRLMQRQDHARFVRAIGVAVMLCGIFLSVR